jgi:hypothetical protein
MVPSLYCWSVVLRAAPPTEIRRRANVAGSRQSATGIKETTALAEERPMTAATIPVTVAEDAAARVAELGLQHEFAQMIEHARQTLPGLRQLRVGLEYDPVHPEYEPKIVILAQRDAPRRKSGRT